MLDEHGEPLHMLEPASRILVRISVRADDDVCAMPNVGFMLRNQLGIDFSGTNTAREGYQLEPMQAGDIYTVISISTCRSYIRRRFLFRPRSPTERSTATRCAIGSITPSRCK